MLWIIFGSVGFLLSLLGFVFEALFLKFFRVDRQHLLDVPEVDRLDEVIIDADIQRRQVRFLTIDGDGDQNNIARLANL